MPTYPKNARSCIALAGQKIYPAAGSVLDISRFVRTKPITAQSTRDVIFGDRMYSADDINHTTPLVYIGNNLGGSWAHPWQKDKMMEAAAKWAASGVNLMRLHAPELYLMTASATTGQPGSAVFNPDRWDEFCWLIHCLRTYGIRYMINLGGSVLGLDLGTASRYSSTPNTSGSFTMNVNADGTIAAPTILNGGNHTHPPTVLVTVPDRSPGTGAVIRPVMTGTAITGWIIDNPGEGYVAGQVGYVILGGATSCKLRTRLDEYVRINWFDTLKAFVLPVMKYSNVSVLNDPACIAWESFNESHMMAPIGQNGYLAQYYRPYLKYSWHAYLKNVHGSIANLKEHYGVTNDINYNNLTAFSDERLLYRHTYEAPADTSPFQKALWSDSKGFLQFSDIKIFKYYVDCMKSLGWTGLMLTRDMGGDMDAVMVAHESGANAMGMHAYLGLCDNHIPDGEVSCNVSGGNTPAAVGQNTVFNVLAVKWKGKPYLRTECGDSLPVDSRAELGPVEAAMMCFYGLTATVHHSSSALALEFGPQNPTQLRGLWPHQWEMDPHQKSGIWVGALVSHRGDLDELPVMRTIVQNRRSLWVYTNPADRTLATMTFTSLLQYVPATTYHFAPVMRTEIEWDPENDQAKAATYLNTSQTMDNSPVESLASIYGRVGKYGWDVNKHPSYWWWQQGNQNQLQAGGFQANAIRTSPATADAPCGQFGFDQVLGLMYLSSARTQTAIPSKSYRITTGSHVKDGVLATQQNANRTKKGLPGNGYSLNAQGKRIWKNLIVTHLEDNVHLTVTSATMDPIETTDRMVIVVSSPCDNDGVQFKSKGNRVTTLTGNFGTAGPYDVAPWGTFGTTGVGAIARFDLDANGMVSGYSIENGGGVNYPASVTATLQGGTLRSGGTALSITAVGLEPAPADKAAKFLVPYSDATLQGWPFGQRRHVAEFIIERPNLDGFAVYELDFTGKRIGMIPTRKVTNGLKILIDSSRTKQPSIFFELVKGHRYRKMKA